MKTGTRPPLRASPELRAEAEAVFAPGESLSSFVHDAGVRSVDFRKAQQKYVKRGLASGATTRRSGRYVSSDAALKSLRRQLRQRSGCWSTPRFHAARAGQATARCCES